MRNALPFLLCALATPAMADPCEAPLPKPGTVFSCRGAGVVDGDTMRCAGGLRVRLWGIQAPERKDPAGPASTRALARLAGAQTLTCEAKARDRYCRAAALCRVRGVDVAGEMVRQGQAADWPRYSGGYYGRGAP